MRGRLFYRLFLSGVLAIGALSGFVQGGTISFLTSTAASAANQFTAGTLNLGLTAISGSLSFADMEPGDSITRQFTVQNSGSLTLRYSMATSTSGSAALATALQLTIYKDQGDNCATQGADVPYPAGTLSAAGFGDPATGQQSGDRQLAPGASEDFCFQASLPSVTGLEGASLTATFTFQAEQVSGT